MQVHTKQLQLDGTDSLDAKNGVSLEAHRETLYAVKAYAPVAVDSLVEVLRGALKGNWSRKMRQLEAKIFKRDGVDVLSVADIADAFRNLPLAVNDFIFGNPIWVDSFHNLVTTAGLNDSLAKQFKATAYTAVWYVGLTAATPTFAAADTAASHTGWTEATAYSETVRQTLVLGSVAAGSVDNSASKAVFTINATVSIGGSFLISDNAKSGTAGVLYGGAAFGGGNRALQIGDTLTITLTLTAS